MFTCNNPNLFKVPLFAGYSYASPNLVGANMALIGALVTLGLIVRRKRLVTQVV